MRNVAVCEQKHVQNRSHICDAENTEYLTWVKKADARVCYARINLTCLLIIADSVYKKGFIAELIGNTNTAVYAYTSPDIIWPFKAIRPEILNKMYGMLNSESHIML